MRAMAGPGARFTAWWLKELEFWFPCPKLRAWGNLHFRLGFSWWGKVLNSWQQGIKKLMVGGVSRSSPELP